MAAYKALFSMLNDGSFPSHTVTPPHFHSHESSHHPQADDLEDAHSEESVQILKARGELENAEKVGSDIGQMSAGQAGIFCTWSTALVADDVVILKKIGKFSLETTIMISTRIRM